MVCGSVRSDGEGAEMLAHRLNRRDGLAVGVMLFSMFFGAGNLILAPLLGVQAAGSTPLALAGFIVSAVGLPVLTIAAIALSGSVRQLADRISPLFSEVFAALVYLAIGPFLAIPRTATTSYEMLRPLLPTDLSPTAALLVFSLAFFAVAYVLAMHPSRLTELMGKASGPALLLLIVLVVGAVLVSPPGGPASAAAGDYAARPLVAGFVCGYQTMDVLAALAFGIVIAMNVREKGLEDTRDVARQVMRSGAIAGVLMMLIYCGFGYLGYTMGSVVPGVGNGAEVIAAAARIEFGSLGAVLVAAIFGLACLNVCIGLTCSISEYFSERYARLGYRQWALAVVVVSFLLSNVGLTAILGYSVPLLLALYPVAICLVAMGLLQGRVGRSGVGRSDAGNAGARVGDARDAPAWRLAVALCALDSVTVALRDGYAPTLWLPFDMLPLADLRMGWITLAVLGLVVGRLWRCARNGEGGVQ